MRYLANRRVGMALSKALFHVLILTLLASKASCRSMPTNLLFVDDSLDIYENGLRVAHYELWPFPFIEAVSLLTNLLLFLLIFLITTTFWNFD